MHKIPTTSEVIDIHIRDFIEDINNNNIRVADVCYSEGFLDDCLKFELNYSDEQLAYLLRVVYELNHSVIFVALISYLEQTNIVSDSRFSVLAEMVYRIYNDKSLADELQYYSNIVGAPANM
jgi:hypothetical protein